MRKCSWIWIGSSVILVLICILGVEFCGDAICGLQNIDPIESARKEQFSKYGYWTYSTPYYLSGGYSFDCVQVDGMENEQLQDKINVNLKRYFCWIDFSTIDDYIPCEPQIHLQSSRYISIEYCFLLQATWKQEAWLCFTVDMQNGEVVYIDDLIDLNEEFAMRLKTGNVLRQEVEYYTAEENAQEINKEYSTMTVEEILREFNYYTRGRYLDDRVVGDKYVFWNRFYLEEGAVCYRSSGEYKILMIDKVEEFLKVPKW